MTYFYFALKQFAYFMLCKKGWQQSAHFVSADNTDKKMRVSVSQYSVVTYLYVTINAVHKKKDDNLAALPEFV